MTVGGEAQAGGGSDASAATGDEGDRTGHVLPPGGVDSGATHGVTHAVCDARGACAVRCACDAGAVRVVARRAPDMIQQEATGSAGRVFSPEVPA
ncbi:hypothetical protein GCM10018773_02370 [Streptomyces candidus]|nr:hypothetical protein GCM10018773_02370 [Streptomyces candidus]